MDHPLAKISYPDWNNLKEQNILSESAAEKLKFIEQSSKQNEPYRIKEHSMYAEAIAQTTIHESPVFVIGHWRSGTTHLQNILTQDDRFGFLNVAQSMNPHAFLLREAADIDEFKETTRFMDNVVLNGLVPSEEEVALGILAEGSFWHGYYLTDKMDYYFNKFTLLNDINEIDLENWKSDYKYLLKKLTLRHKGKPLFLKNPPNTCRLKILLEMFPKAKFIHIKRNPYKVFFSRMRQYNTAIRFKSLQEISEEQWEQKVFSYYKSMMAKHFEERNLIPDNQYIEISFEDLKSDPMVQLKTIYDHLDLFDFEGANDKFKSYLNSLQSYKQNKYQFDENKLDQIYSHWNFTIDKWAYKRPQ